MNLSVASRPLPATFVVGLAGLIDADLGQELSASRGQLPSLFERDSFTPTDKSTPF